MSLRKLLLERMMLSDYTKYSKAVAEAYKARPVKEYVVMDSYRALNRHNKVMFKRLLSDVDVIFTEEQPYQTAQEMTQQVKETGKLYINNQYSENLSSGWTEEENWQFRAVHDYIVHIGGKVDFSTRGEIQAFNVHAKLVPPRALDALFSEVIGQVCYVNVFGDFPDPQKACKLYGFDYKKLGIVDWVEYKKNFTENPIRPYQESEIERIIKKVKF